MSGPAPHRRQWARLRQGARGPRSTLHRRPLSVDTGGAADLPRATERTFTGHADTQIGHSEGRITNAIGWLWRSG